MTRRDFKAMSVTDQGITLLSKGRHLTQIKKGNQLLNLYSIEDFFVEVYYSVLSDKISRIEIVTDLSRIDQYIDDQHIEENLGLN